MKKLALVLIALSISVTMITPCIAMDRHHSKNKTAIVIAGFGCSYPSALVSITNIQRELQKAFPNVKVEIAFTSNIIRRIWHHRQHDKKFLKKYKNIPKEILYVKGPLATIADLQDRGYQTIIVQPTHLYDGEEFTDLCSYVRGLNSIETIKPKYKPFKKLVVGRPAFGRNGPKYDYHEDLVKAAETLRADVALAKKKGAALVYMGHGNEFYSTGVYIEFQQVMRKMYPEVKIFVGTVEGFPSRDDVLVSLKHAGVRNVVLKPLMVVAGDHANNDMAGDDGDSWKSVFEKEGIRVHPVLHGLGENPEWAKIYVDHVKDVARDHQISL